MSTQLGKIPHIIGICLQLDHVENFTKLGVSVRKQKQCKYPKSLYTLYDEILVNAVSKVYLHKLQRKYSLRTVLQQVLFGRSITLNLLDLYEVIHRAWPRHINLHSFPLKVRVG